MGKKERIALICILLLALGSVAVYDFFMGSPADQRAAQGHALEFIAEKYAIPEGQLLVESALYNSRRGHFAIYIVNKETAENYFVEVNLTRNREVLGIFDATGLVMR